MASAQLSGFTDTNGTPINSLTSVVGPAAGGTFTDGGAGDTIVDTTT